MRSIFANSHSLLQSGQTLLVFNQRWMQSKWKTWPQQPKAMLRPFSLLGLGFAWYSIDGSFNEFLQMAQVSAQMSQDHMQTCASMAFMVARFRGRVASLERRARGGGGASLGGGRRAAFGALSMDALSETMRARRGRRVIQHSTF